MRLRSRGSKAGHALMLAAILAPVLVLSGGRDPAAAQLTGRPKLESPVRLEALTPKLGETERLEGRVEESLDLNGAALPQSDWKRAYEIGRKLYAEGDMRRALNAFKLAMVRARDYRPEDPRVAQTTQAIRLAQQNMTMDAQLGFKLQSGAKPGAGGTVEKVFPASLAWLSGIKPGDRVLSERVAGGRVHLSISRSGRVHDVSFALGSPRPALAAQAPIAGRVAAEATRIDGGRYSGRIVRPEVLTSRQDVIKSYDCAVIVDCSGSMAHPVAPGDPSGWDWCRAESERLLTASPHLTDGITLVVFNDRFAVAKNATVADIRDVYGRLQPGGGTRMAPPLQYVLDDYFRRKSAGSVRPLAIAVLTDGVSSDFLQVRDAIHDATARVSGEREIVVTFLQIGGRPFGSDILDALDNDLVRSGARFDIVDTRTFDELRRLGLRNAIIAAIVEPEAEGRR